ncbi:hypothetical protein ES288_1Z021200v1 [Gossypium darwinii]|uniref:tRNA (adenine(58)-N(1))-methyltransferase n=1 Tax=Gossypium darwinii TaxID=34276 RepID=A0A5C7IZH6_GOSDA|nr:hypothetical protein ES288_1Z021200v1 [Gossypium darwinii]
MFVLAEHLSVGRLRERVLRRPSLSNFTLCPLQQSSHVGSQTHAFRGDRDTRQFATSPSKSTSVSGSAHTTTVLSHTPVFNIQGHEVETSQSREARRRRIRSQVSDLLAPVTQLHNLEKPGIMIYSSTTARASLYRIVMLAEALFELNMRFNCVCLDFKWTCNKRICGWHFSLEILLMDSSMKISFNRCIRDGDLIIVNERHDTTKAVKVCENLILQNHVGVFKHSDWVGKPFGSITFSNKGGFVYLLAPAPELWTLVLSHRTQILYIADIIFVIMYLEVVPGCLVLESGTSSGSNGTCVYL